jgi:4-hydroxybenzoate polyprenyltransferase
MRQPTGNALTPASASLARYLLSVSRPRFWLYLGGTALVGVVWGASSLESVLQLVPVALVAYFLMPANLFLYGVNDRFDAPTDAQNPRKGAGGPEVRSRDDRRVDAAVLGAGLLGLPFAIWLPPLGTLALLGFLALAVGYSAPPARFKARPLLDSLSNGLYVLPGVVGYAATAGRLPAATVLLAGWAWTMGMHTFSAIPDIEPDRAAGVTTTATRLGRRTALAYVVGCWIAAAALAAVHDPRLGLLFSVYPILGGAIAVADWSVARAYRRFPWVNAAVGGVLTIAGLWRVTGGV